MLDACLGKNIHQITLIGSKAKLENPFTSPLPAPEWPQESYAIDVFHNTIGRTWLPEIRNNSVQSKVSEMIQE